MKRGRFRWYIYTNHLFYIAEIILQINKCLIQANNFVTRQAKIDQHDDPNKPTLQVRHMIRHTNSFPATSSIKNCHSINYKIDSNVSQRAYEQSRGRWVD
jgi:hypothetical protein